LKKKGAVVKRNRGKINKAKEIKAIQRRIVRNQRERENYTQSSLQRRGEESEN